MAAGGVSGVEFWTPVGSFFVMFCKYTVLFSRVLSALRLVARSARRYRVISESPFSALYLVSDFGFKSLFNWPGVILKGLFFTWLLSGRSAFFGEIPLRPALLTSVCAMEPERARIFEVEEFVLDSEDSLSNVSSSNEDAVEGGTFIVRFNVRVRGKPMIKVIMYNRCWEKMNVRRASEGTEI